MTTLSKLIGTMIGGLLIGFPGLLLAQERCILTSEAELSRYVSLLIEGVEKDDDILLVEGDEDTPEKAFVRGTIGVRSADLFIAAQFDRDGTVTNFDVQRQTSGPTDEVVVYLLDECLDPYEETLAPLAEPIAKRLKSEIAKEDERKAKAGL